VCVSLSDWKLTSKQDEKEGVCNHTGFAMKKVAEEDVEKMILLGENDCLQ
jgi:hydrogenase maturation factor